MTEAELLQRIALGEDSRLQFKRTVTHPDALATELVAFSNSGGGTLLLGVNDDGSIAGLDAVEVRRLNQVLSNTASQHLRPPISPLTENVLTGQNVLGQRTDGWAQVLAGRVAQYLIQTAHLDRIQAGDAAIVIHTEQQRAATAVGEGHQLRCQRIGVSHGTLELQATVFSQRNALKQLCLGHAVIPPSSPSAPSAASPQDKGMPLPSTRPDSPALLPRRASRDSLNLSRESRGSIDHTWIDL